jgi:nicotinamide-nucleotide amidase
MMKLPSKVLEALAGKTLVTAESITGGGIGAALTAVPGSSAVYKGGIICYCNQVKHKILGVDANVLETLGPVSAPVAKAMAEGACRVLEADVSVSVTGLAGPGGDEYGNAAGTVFIGCCMEGAAFAREYHFEGDREAVRQQTIRAALNLVLETWKGVCETL